MKLYTILDTKGDRCTPPFAATTDAEAKRIIMVAVFGSGTLPSQYPEDFVLIGIAEWDEQTGVVAGYDVPVTIGNLEAIKTSFERLKATKDSKEEEK